MVNHLLTDKIKGVLFGQAIGDALGFGAEFMSHQEILKYYPNGLNNYSEIQFFSKITKQFEPFEDWRWQRGDWTDDTDQMLCILDSLLAKKKVDLNDIARRLQDWSINDGFDVGRTFANITRHPEFLNDPQKIAYQYWENSGFHIAPNGGVMRTSILGIWQYQNSEQVCLNAQAVCKLTHADPRCVASCIAVCFAISQILQGRENLPLLIEEIYEKIKHFHPEIEEYFALIKNPNLAELRLDEGLNEHESLKIGYTLKTLSAGLWALLHADSFQEGILAIIHAGGDADTNAAVAGALLGAKFGYHNLKSDWLEGLIYQQELATKINQLMELIL